MAMEIPREATAVKSTKKRLRKRRTRHMPSTGRRRQNSSGAFVIPGAGLEEAADSAVWIVSTTVCEVVEGARDAGSKRAVDPGGKPLTENVMVLPSAPCGAMVNWNVALWPGKTVAD
jgi:hypothetical protein